MVAYHTASHPLVNAKPVSYGRMAKQDQPRLDPKDRERVSKGDLEDVSSRLASTPMGAIRSENGEPTWEELNRLHRLVRWR